MAWPPTILWFDVLGGQNSQPMEDLRQGRDLVEMTTASNVIPDPPGNLITSPGFSKVRATAITDSPAITGMFWMGDLANEFILGNSVTGGINRDNANPPGAITGGTAFGTGANVLLRGDFFENLLIICSNARNLPQTVTAGVVRADLGGTPPRGIDYKVLGRRGMMFSPTLASVTYRFLVSYNSANDDHDSWTTPVTTNSLNFGKYEGDVNILGGEYFKDHVIAFSENACYPIYATPNADQPLATQAASFSEKGGGPPNIQAVVAAGDRLWWISRNFDVKTMLPDGSVRSIGRPIQPFLRGLSDSRRIYTIGGYESQYRMVWWAVSDGSDTQNNDAVGVQIDSGQFFFRTISRNAFAHRVVSGQQRLIGGGYTGFFYNDFDSSTTGDLDDSASAIDADIQTPRHHLGLPGVFKKIPYVAVDLDPIGTEAVTFQYQLNDGQTWTSFSESPVTVSGTDKLTIYLRTSFVFERIRLRFRDANSGQRFRVLRYGFPRPTVVQARLS